MWKYPEVLKSAFPSMLGENVEKIILTSSVDEDYVYPPTELFSVSICGEIIKIPERIYLGQNIQGMKNLSKSQLQLINCFFTRHHNGYVREKYLKKIILINEPWVAPYIVRLFGEYVIEILNIIYENFNTIDMAIYRAFIEENPIFYAKIKRRVISYWNCYYRNQYRDKNNYVGIKILEAIENAL